MEIDNARRPRERLLAPDEYRLLGAQTGLVALGTSLLPWQIFRAYSLCRRCYLGGSSSTHCWFSRYDRGVYPNVT